MRKETRVVFPVVIGLLPLGIERLGPEGSHSLLSSLFLSPADTKHIRVTRLHYGEGWFEE